MHIRAAIFSDIGLTAFLVQDIEIWPHKKGGTSAIFSRNRCFIGYFTTQLLQNPMSSIAFEVQNLNHS